MAGTFGMLLRVNKYFVTFSRILEVPLLPLLTPLKSNCTVTQRERERDMTVCTVLENLKAQTPWVERQMDINREERVRSKSTMSVFRTV